MVASRLKPNHREDVSLKGGAEGRGSEKNQLGSDYSCLDILSGTEQGSYKDSDSSATTSQHPLKPGALAALASCGPLRKEGQCAG